MSFFSTSSIYKYMKEKKDIIWGAKHHNILIEFLNEKNESKRTIIYYNQLHHHLIRFINYILFTKYHFPESRIEDLVNDCLTHLLIKLIDKYDKNESSYTFIYMIINRFFSQIINEKNLKKNSIYDINNITYESDIDIEGNVKGERIYPVISDKVNDKIDYKDILEHFKGVLSEVRAEHQRRLDNEQGVKQNSKRIIYLTKVIEYIDKYNDLVINRINEYILYDSYLGESTIKSLSKLYLGTYYQDKELIDNADRYSEDYIQDDYTGIDDVNKKRIKRKRINDDYLYF